ncbi:hypothetical protein [Lysobacter gummosus]|uniref:hypothetical protein n=1 Tax=Lysobacter gummosus TaxID=262324 RepID=UPI003644BC68
MHFGRLSRVAAGPDRRRSNLFERRVSERQASRAMPGSIRTSAIVRISKDARRPASLHAEVAARMDAAS